jgi:hypothetical protein
MALSSFKTNYDKPVWFRVEVFVKLMQTSALLDGIILFTFTPGRQKTQASPKGYPLTS